jgi:hypothetical protein
MTADPQPDPGTITGAATGTVVTLHAEIIRADGTRHDLGVIASSDPARAPITPRETPDDG